MKYLKTLIILISFVLVTSLAFAEDNKHDQVLEYLKLSKTKETFEMTIDTYVQQLSAQHPDADSNKIRYFFNKSMGWEVIKEPITKLVEKFFTAKELKDINDFYKTKSGKSYADKSPELTAELSKILATNLQSALQRMEI